MEPDIALAPKAERRAYYDGIISASRARTPAAVMEQRKAPRYSISELDDADVGAIRDRIAANRFDDRGPVQRAVELLELPRGLILNSITNVIAPSLRQKKFEAGDVDQFGLPKIYTSDILDHFGVDNRIVKGVVGFIGDTVFDPLTYVGPPGWGAKAVSTGGKVAATGILGRLAMRNAVKAVDRGVLPAEKSIAEYLTHAGLDLTHPERGAFARKALYGDGQTPLNRFLSVLGGDVERKGGILADAAESGLLAQRPQAQSARDFLGKYGRDTLPGVRIGKDGVRVASQGDTAMAGGSAIAHIPFTDISLTVPAFTQAAHATANMGKFARATAAALPPDLAAGVAGLETITKDVNRHLDIGKELNDIDTKAKTDPTFAPFADYIRQGLVQEHADVAKRIESGRAALDRHLAKAIADPAKSINEIVAIQRLRDTAAETDRWYRAHNTSQLIADQAVKAEDARLTGLIDKRTKTLAAEEKARLAAIPPPTPHPTRAEMIAELDDFPAVAVQNQHILDNGTDEEIRNLVNQTRADFAPDKPPIAPLPPTRDSLIAEINAAADVDPKELDAATDDELRSAANQIRQSVGQPLHPPPPPPPPTDAAINAVARKRALDELRATDGRSVAAHFDALTPEQIEVRKQTADLFAQRMGASRQLADVAGKSLLQTAKSSDLDLARAASYALGYSPEEIGHGPFMSMADAITSVFGNKTGDAMGFMEAARRADRNFLGAFGNHRNLIHETQRAIQRAKSYNDPELVQRMIQFEKEIKDAVASHPGLTEGDASDALRWLQYRAADPKSEVFWPNDPAWAALKNAVSAGVLSDPAKLKTLEGIAQRNSDMLRDMLEVERRAGLLGEGVEGYVPHVQPQAGAAYMREQLLNYGNKIRNTKGGTDTANKIGGVAEDFTKPRSTLMHQFEMPVKNEMGEVTMVPAQFAEFERWVQRFDTPADIESWRRADPAVADYIKEALAKIKAYDKLPGTLKPPPRQMSIDWINQYAANGAFKVFDGGRGAKFMEDSPARYMAERTASHRVAMFQAYFTELTNRYALPINKLKLARQVGVNKTFELDNGVVGKIGEERVGKDSVHYITIGKEKFRAVAQSAMNNESNPLRGIIGNRAHEAFYPERVAEAIEAVSDMFKSPEDTARWLRMADSFVGMWKGVTLAHPSWMVGNMLGSMIQLSALGIAPWQYAKYARPALEFMKNIKRPDKLASIVFESEAGHVTGTELLKSLNEVGVLNSSITAEVVAQLLAGGHILTPTQHSLIKAIAKGNKAGLKAAVKEMTESAEMQARAAAYGASLQGKGMNAYRKGKALVIDEYLFNRVMKPWFAINAKAEDWMRVMGYMALRDKGLDTTSAARRITEGMFDFSDMTRTETNVLRRLMPFYAWLKSSGFYGVRQLMENPKYLTMVPNARRAVEEAINGENTVPDYARPNWMKEQLALQVGSEPDKRTAVMIGTLLPQEMATRLLAGAAAPVTGMTGVWDLISYLGQSVTPLLRIPQEIGAGKEAYTGRTISLRRGEGDMDVPEYLLQQIRPLREFGIGQTRRGAMVSAGEQGPVAVGLRGLLGGRSQPFTDDRIKFSVEREFREREDAIKRRVRLAAREGNAEAELRAKVKLLALYKAMQEKGVKVPAWARGQLTEMSSG